ncbi:hypothetical protein WME98_48740 [Sorangium sp. So ce296]
MSHKLFSRRFLSPAPPVRNSSSDAPRRAIALFVTLLNRNSGG